MKLLIEALDVLLFRDGRPFNAGEDHVALSQFPPPPSVIQGMIRTTYLVQHPDQFDDYISLKKCGAWDDIGDPGAETLPDGKWIKGPFLAREGNGDCELFYPIPADVRRASSYALARPADEKMVPEGFASSLPADLKPLMVTDQPAEYVQGYLDGEALARYLMGQSPEKVIAADELVKTDFRVGVGIQSDKRLAKDGMLYSAHFSRPAEGVGLAVEVEGIPLKEDGLSRLGGEARGACYRTVDWKTPEPPEGLAEKIRQYGRFSLYLLTPGLFSASNGEYGWRPDWTQAGLPTNAKLSGTALPPPVDIGGWKLARGGPKPTRSGVAAGSVYFLNCEAPLDEEAVKSLFETRWFQALPGPCSQIGMGITLIGGWDYV